MAWRPFRNFRLKLAAVALGSLVWFTVTGERVERRISRVEIYHSGLPASLVLTEELPSVDVTVRGTYADISQLPDIAITADLSDAMSGLYVLPLSVDQVTVPSGVDVVQIYPSVVTLYIEQSDSRFVPIDPSIDGEPASGFVVTDRIVEPATVEIMGPLSRLSPTTTALTERISIEGASATFTRSVTVGVADAQLQLVESLQATVTVVIEPARVTRTLELMTVDLPNLAADVEVLGVPAVVSVVVRGTSTALSSLAESDVTAQIDMAGLGPGEYTLDVDVRIPPGLELENVSPSTVTLRVR